MSYNATAGGSNPTDQTVTISNTGTGTLTWNATKSNSWLTISPASGSCPPNSTMTASINISGLAAGTYTDTINFTSNGGSGSTSVTLNVAAAPTPVFSRAPASLTFNAVAGGSNPADQTVTISNTGTGTLTWNATKSNSWLTISPASGSCPPNSTMTVSINIGGLAAGTYNDTINFTSNGGSGSTSITLNVTAAPTPVFSRAPASLTFNAVAGGSNPADQTVTISNTGTGTLTWNATKSNSWLTISPASGSCPPNSTMTASINISGLAVGTYTDTINFTSNGGSGSTSVTLNVTAIPGPTITRLEKTSVPGVATTEAIVGEGISIIGTNFGATQGTSTVTINGTPVTTFYFWNATKIDLAVPAGATSGNVVVTVSSLNSNNMPLTINTVSGPTITTTSLLGGTVSMAYSQTLAATGGTTPYTWSVSSGTLPTGLSLNTSTGVISGTPTTVQTANFTVQVSGGGTDTQDLSIVISDGGTPPAISGINPSTAAVGQTITISGSHFGSTMGTSTITIGGVTAAPASWSDGTIVVAIPAGVTPGSAAVTVTTSGGSDTENITVNNGTIGSIYIDDFEGGCVDNWTAPAATSGYYTFGTGITPDNAAISTDGPQSTASKEGSRGMRVRYAFTSGWGGGWGGKLVSTRDLTSANYVSFYIKWDGSSNSIKLALKDADGTSYATTIQNPTLMALSGYGKVTIAKSNFAYDLDGSDTGANLVFDWTKVAYYNFVYNTTGTATDYQYIDSLVASVSQEVVPPVGDAPVINTIAPDRAPTGTRITVNGLRFGSAQGSSHLDFENTSTHVSYQAEIVSWSETGIAAIVPRLATVGTYEVKVTKVSVVLGIVNALESNTTNFQVTASGAGDIATIYPNPFNPNSQSVTIAVNNTGGAANVGYYIFDMTAKLVKKEVLSASQTTWDGKDQFGSTVGDGAYLLRVINEDTKTLIAKGKILVVKR